MTNPTPQADAVKAATGTHTPGPWIVETDQTFDGSNLIVIDIKGQHLIADCRDINLGVVSCMEAEANARLIAAAPELLTLVDYALGIARVERQQLLEDGHQPDGMTIRGIEIEISRYEAALAKL